MVGTDPFRKVHSGEPFHMSAAAYNAFVDAARAHAQKQHPFGAPRHPENPLRGQILVRNDTGEPCDRYSVLGIAGPLIDPSDNLPEFQRLLAVRGDTPAAEHAGRFVILLEPLNAGSIGRACIDGVCAVQVEMTAETDGYADAAEGVLARLQSAETGAARLLWVQPVEDRTDPDVAWTLVRIGGGGGGGAAARALGEIVTVAGTSPPYLYTLRAVAPTGQTAFGDPTGPDVDVANLYECGPLGAGAHAVPVGTVVEYWAVGGFYFFDTSHYRGTY